MPQKTKYYVVVNEKQHKLQKTNNYLEAQKLQVELNGEIHSFKTKEAQNQFSRNFHKKHKGKSTKRKTVSTKNANVPFTRLIDCNLQDYELIIYTDGSAKWLTSEKEAAVISYGCFFVYKDLQHSQIEHKIIAVADSNRAEIEAVQLALDLLSSYDIQNKTLIVTDNVNVLKQIDKSLTGNNKNNVFSYNQLAKLTDVSFVWVKAHHEINGNTHIDTLVNERCRLIVDKINQI